VRGLARAQLLAHALLHLGVLLVQHRAVQQAARLQLVMRDGLGGRVLLALQVLVLQVLVHLLMPQKL
jgi:hypothetical protein